VEVAPLVASGLQRAEQGRHPGDQLVDHGAIMAVTAAAGYRPGVSDGLATADEALVPRAPPPEPRAGVRRLVGERPGRVVRDLRAGLDPVAGHGPHLLIVP
jgi:hypothetical protein